MKAKDKENLETLKLKIVAQQIRTTLDTLNSVLEKAKDLNLKVTIYEVGSSPSKTFNQYSQLSVSDIYFPVKY